MVPFRKQSKNKGPFSRFHKPTKNGVFFTRDRLDTHVFAIYAWRYKRKSNWFYDQYLCEFNIKVFCLIVGSASKSNFWQYYKGFLKENLIDLRFENQNIKEFKSNFRGKLRNTFFLHLVVLQEDTQLILKMKKCFSI